MLTGKKFRKVNDYVIDSKKKDMWTKEIIRGKELMCGIIFFLLTISPSFISSLHIEFFLWE